MLNPLEKHPKKGHIFCEKYVKNLDFLNDGWYNYVNFPNHKTDENFTGQGAIDREAMDASCGAGNTLALLISQTTRRKNMALRDDPVKMREYKREWIANRRQKYMAEYGPCYFCETTENLEIHHIDPSEKENHAIWSWSQDRIEAELAKCLILCHKCHAKMHTIMKRRPFEHGTYYAYHVYKCRCVECRAANAQAKRTGTYR